MRTADEYIKMVVQKKYQPFAKVIVSHAKKGVHVPLKPNEPLPEDDDERTIFLRVEGTV